MILEKTVNARHKRRNAMTEENAYEIHEKVRAKLREIAERVNKENPRQSASKSERNLAILLEIYKRQVQKEGPLS